MMNIKRSLIVTGIIAACVSGCANSPNDKLLDRLDELEELAQDRENKRLEHQQEKLEAELDKTPVWVISPPASDEQGLYGVGIGQSKVLSHALKSSKLQGEFDLAKQFKQELSGSERSFEQGDANGDVVSQTQFLIDKLVREVPVVGFEIVEREVIPLNGKFHVYTLMRLPYKQFNKVLQQERAKEVDDKFKEAFDDLERRLANKRKSVETTKQNEFEREITRSHSNDNKDLEKDNIR